MGAIKVVSFVNEEIVQNEDLNSIFNLPYKLKTLSDKLKYQLNNEIENNYSKEDWFDNWCSTFTNNQVYIDKGIILSYFKENVMDLYRTSLIWFLDNYFSYYYQSDNLFTIPYEVEIRPLGNTQVILSTDTNKYDISVYYILLDQLSDQYITAISAIYNSIIYDRIIYLINNRRINNLYEDWYQKVYNENPTNYNADYIYTFCMSLLREQAEDELIKIRKAMTLVVGNTAQLFFSRNNGGILLENSEGVIESNE